MNKSQKLITCYFKAVAQVSTKMNFDPSCSSSLCYLMTNCRLLVFMAPLGGFFLFDFNVLTTTYRDRMYFMLHTFAVGDTSHQNDVAVN